MIVIIGGMHRSGTSALGGMLHANGIVMGKREDWYPPPMKENPKGFYENVRFRRVNDKILNDNGYKVKSFNPSIPTIPVTDNEKTRDKMKELINEFQEFPNWGWKDPRTCLTLNSWYSVLKEMELIDNNNLRVIVILRPPEDVSNSMRTRGNRERMYGGQFIDLAEVYIKRLVDNLRACDIKAHYVKFYDLLRNTFEEVDKMQIYLGLELPDRSFIDPEIARNVV